MNRTNLVVFTTIVLVLTVALIAIFIAKGYQINFTDKTVSPTGILVATSDPDGAEIIINDKLKTATNNTLNLNPGSYDIKLEKDGFNTWQKKITVKQEEVFKTNAFLFPRVPDLRPLTFTGAINPTVSPDGTKIVFSVASASAEKNGIWIADISRPAILNPLGSPADLRQISLPFASLLPSETNFLWSPDDKEILAYTLLPQSKSILPQSASVSARIRNALVLETDRLNTDPTIATAKFAQITGDWDKTKKTELDSLLTKFDTRLTETLATSSSNLQISPDQTKILYTATSSATIPTVITYYLPGTDPTPESRQITPGHVYVYDSKEDKNYSLDSCDGKSVSCQWFPSSRHILFNSDKEIWVTEYDGTNKAVVYSGPFIDHVVYPWPNWGKIVILTSLNTVADTQANLYTINLR